MTEEVKLLIQLNANGIVSKCFAVRDNSKTLFVSNNTLFTGFQ